jgi:hypothetical protein
MARSKRGKRLGRLFFLLIVATVAYYGVDWGTIQFKRWQLVEEIKAQSGFASSLDNNAIRRRVIRKIESLALPRDALRNLSIRRTMRPREIIVSTEYEVTIVLPFTTRADTISIEVRSPL